jgi:hypothetical protein
MGFKQLKDRAPFKHPEVEKGWTRVDLPEIKAETSKAALFDFADPALKNNGLIWIPKACYKIRWGGSGLNPKDDTQSVLDIADWFYKKEIES